MMINQQSPQKIRPQIGPMRPLEEVRKEADPTAQSIAWCPEDDGMYLEVEWPDGGCSRYLWSTLDARYVHPVAGVQALIARRMRTLGEMHALDGPQHAA